MGGRFQKTYIYYEEWKHILYWGSAFIQNIALREHRYCINDYIIGI